VARDAAQVREVLQEINQRRTRLAEVRNRPNARSLINLCLLMRHGYLHHHLGFRRQFFQHFGLTPPQHKRADFSH
jgi:hypothetical protein